MHTFADLFERTDRVFDLDVFASFSGKCFSHVERLREEALDLTGALYGKLVLVGELFHTKDSNDVLQFLVFLQHVLHLTGNQVMLFTDDHGVQDPRS